MHLEELVTEALQEASEINSGHRKSSIEAMLQEIARQLVLLRVALYQTNLS